MAKALPKVLQTVRHQLGSPKKKLCIEGQALNLIIDIGVFQPLCVYVPTWHHNVLSGPNLHNRKL